MLMQCNFVDNRDPLSLDDTLYTCKLITNITEPKSAIATISGTHINGKTEADVIGIAGFCIMYNVPRGLTKFFENITRLSLVQCELQEISRQDLMEYEKLEFLNLLGNHLTSLPNDLFLGNKNLRWIHFEHNQIEILSSKLLRNIQDNDLQEVNFCNNTKINAYYQKGTINTLEGLMKTIDEKCKPPPNPLRAESHLEIFGQLLVTGNFSDFIIKAGKDSFMVHKNVLALHSEVFNTMFSSKMQEGRNGTLVITDFTASSVKDFLHFLYNGFLKDDLNAMEVFALASKYDVQSLRKISEKAVLQNLDGPNSLEILNLGRLYSSEVLQRAALDEVCKFINVPNDKRLMDHPLLLEAIFKAKKDLDAVLNIKPEI